MVQIQLEDQLAAALSDRARSYGLGLEEFLAEVAVSDVRLPYPPIPGDGIIRLIEEEAGATDSHYKGTYPRDDIYLDHP